MFGNVTYDETGVVSSIKKLDECSTLNSMIFTNFSRSLAIVFTPSLFPVTEEATNIKKVEVTNADLANKLEIVQALIENSNAVSFY